MNRSTQRYPHRLVWQLYLRGYMAYLRSIVRNPWTQRRAHALQRRAVESELGGNSAEARRLYRRAAAYGPRYAATAMHALRDLADLTAGPPELYIANALDVGFCIWALLVDGLHVPPFEHHADGDGTLRAAG